MTIDLQEMKKHLESKRDELMQSIGRLTEIHPMVVDSDTAGDESVEDAAVDVQEQQLEISISANDEALLAQINAALKRIEDGTYGFCVVCGKPISEERLRAIPWATLGVEEEEKLEQVNLSREELFDHNRDTHYA
ncbi:TraR/DksA family transcriptional regulator [Dictyobacter formicarum]|uniref:Zinc finger DksA/TraR C4-type domain-containing protein n=1 Tax=Dictyobacter formicarum TaxID=2778368 RepID=A0ABQ3V9E4_9CHLR|nr:TraR/DksA family transcriptional regulator [Dictyobacter formicarum]GHO82540.1 hypothetical protein KSZ_05460 [Dictyobacter formicarum]